MTQEVALLRPITRILAAIKDPMARSLPALQKATQLARALEAHLELFHVIDSPVYVDMLGLTEDGAIRAACDVREQCRQQLERLAARARLHTKSVTVAVDSDYPVYEAIVRRAIAIGADLIIAERHGRRSMAPGLLRLADWELLRLSPVPVLLVKKPHPYHRPTVLAALDPAHAFAKPPDLDEGILQIGTAVADALKGRLHAVHARHPPVLHGRRSSREKTTQDMATRFNQALDLHNVLQARRHLEVGPPCDAVWRVARNTKADIVVAGAISRSGLKRAAFGNTAELLLDCLPCDLLVVKPAGFKCAVSRERRGGCLATVQPLG